MPEREERCHAGVEAMTPRQREVLALVGQGLDCARIASALAIAPDTVRKHRSQLLAKLGQRNTVQLLVHASAIGLRADGIEDGDGNGYRELGRRQRQVIDLVAAGHTSKEIARRLGISPLTVRKHREIAMRKLGVHCMAELIRLARPRLPFLKLDLAKVGTTS